MLKKLTEEKQTQILETAIDEFAQNGLACANINVIAKKAGVSVGVIYKYYDDKEALFFACVNRSLNFLESVLTEIINSNDTILVCARKLIMESQRFSKEHSNYIRMYNEITTGNSQKYAVWLAQKIEGVSSKVYSEFISKAKSEGNIREDIDPKMFAFFFDNLLMMTHFSYSCDYYRERFKIYCGDDIFNRDEFVTSQLLKFLESAFTFKSEDIKKLGEERRK